MFLQEESEELRALQSHIAAAETRLGQRLQLQERSAAATAARQDSIALERALHEQRADVRFWPANNYIKHPGDWGMQPGSRSFGMLSTCRRIGDETTRTLSGGSSQSGAARRCSSRSRTTPTCASSPRCILLP